MHPLGFLKLGKNTYKLESRYFVSRSMVIRYSANRFFKVW